LWALSCLHLISGYGRHAAVASFWIVPPVMLPRLYPSRAN
jgi:hypothetical protein